MTQREQTELLGPLLREVSRSFYLTLRVLPDAVRPQISLAYLLARAADTIADTKTVPRAGRIELLRQLRESLADPSVPRLPPIQPLADQQALSAEKLLLERVPDCFALLAAFPQVDRARITALLTTITTGQIFDLEQFPGESERDLVALGNDEDLDRYTYLVAGCVGEFWTRTAMAHLAGLDGWDKERMEGLGVRFGKGLQLVNLLRDIPKDLRIGRCYLPVAEPALLLDPQRFAEVRSVYHGWLDRATAHLDAGWEYARQVPATQWRLRLACIWPIWIGLKTIARLRKDNPLDPARRIKIARSEVYTIMLRSLLTCWSTKLLDRYYRELQRQATDATS